jgi:hypothetical protein
MRLDRQVLDPVRCDVEIVEGVDSDGTIVAGDCERQHGHDGDHDPRPATLPVGRAADRLIDHAQTTVRRVRWNLQHGEHLDVDDLADIIGPIDDVRRDLTDL